MMEYLEMGDLGVYRKKYEPSEADIKRITRQILQAIAAMHALELTHRDIKPGVRPYFAHEQTESSQSD